MTPETKSSLTDKHRDLNVDNREWHDGLDDQIAADLEKVGFTAEDFQWSGFWSQGDGASFTGYVHDLLLFMATLEKDSDVEFPNIRALIGVGGDVSFNVQRRDRHYSHSMTVSCDVEFGGYEDMFNHTTLYSDANDVRYLAACAMDRLVGAECDLLEEHGMKYLRGKMDEFYKMLQEEYEYLTSDEQVWEAIVACGLDEDEAEDQEMENA